MSSHEEVEAAAQGGSPETRQEDAIERATDARWFAARAQLLLISGVALGLIALMCVIVGAIILSRV